MFNQSANKNLAYEAYFENLIPRVEILKTIDKIKNKYKQEANGDSISELIVNTNHGTIIRAGVTYKKSFYKSLLHSAYL